MQSNINYLYFIHLVLNFDIFVPRMCMEMELFRQLNQYLLRVNQTMKQCKSINAVQGSSNC